MPEPLPAGLIEFDVSLPIWDRFFMVAPLTLVGTVEADGRFDLAPKHMVVPMGWQNYIGFVCTPRHRTYQNIKRDHVFTVSFPRPGQLVGTSLSATPRGADDVKPGLAAVTTFPARQINGYLVEGAAIALECKRERIIDGFGENSLIVGDIVAAYGAADATRDAEHDDQELLAATPLLAYLQPGRWAQIGMSYSFPFAEGMKK
jgi:flavin reductase (DIM6/NTAB) family NADH-FMN oxidoreductase RutF